MSIFKQNNEILPGASSKPFVTAIVVAAGNSTRMGGVNKQFLLIDGVPVLIRTLRAFSQCNYINEIIVAAREEDIPKMFSMIKEYEVLKVTDIVKGGVTREESVFSAIRRSSPFSEYLCIHDGARPLVTDQIISDTVETAFKTKAAATGVRVKDTIKIVNSDNVIVSTPERNNLWAVHTPQVFERQMYLSAVDNVINSEHFTDDCRLIEEYGEPVTMVEGSYENIKITTPDDICVAQAIINRRENDD